MRFGFFLHIVVVVLVSGTCLTPSSSSQAAVGESSPRPLDLSTPEMSAAIAQVLSELEDSGNEPSRLLEVWELHRDELRQDREAAVDHLAADRRSESKQDRLAAVFLLGKLWGPSAVRMLQALAQDDPASDVRLAALESLVWGGGFVDTAWVLRESFEKHSAEERSNLEPIYGVKSGEELLAELEAVLSSVGAEIEAAKRPPYWEAERDERASSRAALLVPAILEEVIRQSTGPTGVVTEYVYTPEQLRELRELGPAALPPLIEAFAAPTHSTRLVGRPLAEIGGWELVALLSHVALEHPDPARRQHALRFLLEASQFEHLLRTLGREATEEGDTEIGRFARSALAACRPRESPPWNLESPRGMNR